MKVDRLEAGHFTSTRKMLALKQVELTHWVDHGMTTPHEVVLDRLESQFVRAFCIPTPG